ncbi:hypothetical protein FHS61_000179 [Altererythrobacter atlanticus]|uniref:Deacetylase PdaC domain-containing protein n=1 Tax=Croceibacterium atlanticum TaxID=1267766 RepID=A0A0F7KS74_9SPHN|nr:DUF4163 domain-containing protein [Croceibacterium atlanticum]AKH42409.1 hypothetical protein WYH_01368 [Croceibacterium atlanticum]MBB5731186.1 hypothetical protein [Croceibacterium atlanticum]
MRYLVSVLVAAGMVTACTDGEDATTPTPGTSQSPVSDSTPGTPSDTVSEADDDPTDDTETSVIRSNGALTISEETDDYLFEYSYPSAAGNIPELAKLLDKRLERHKARLARDSAEARQEARSDGFPYNKHSYSAEWKVVADLARWLSLSSQVSTYSGGAHGNYGFDSLVWDKQEKRAFDAAEMFESAAALDAALKETLCDALNREREKRRGEPVPENGDGLFDQCISLEETTILVGSRGGRKFDRVGVLIGPYVAGPYAEGSFEFTFPVDADLLKAVKPEYRDAFASRN